MSKGYGLPLASELLSESLSYAGRHSVNTSLVSNFISDFYPDKNADSEDLLGMADAARHYVTIRNQNLRGNLWRAARIDQMEFQLRRAISLLLWSYQTTDLEDKIDGLVAFVRGLGSETAYITFNYDLLLETALSKAGINFSYHLPLPPDGVVLLKPHGSINWYENEGSNVNSRVAVGNGTRLIYASLSLGNIFQSQRPVPGLIIAPSPTKRIESEFLRKVWTASSSVIMNARCVTIIGYSLPLADRLARLVLRRAGSTFGNARYITVVNPAPVAAYFQKVIDPKCCLVQKGFGEFVTEIDLYRRQLGS